MGLGARSVVNFSGGEPLCVEVPVTLFRVYLGMVTSFWSTFVLGGGNVTFHGIYMVSRGNYFIMCVSYAPMGHLRMWHVQLS